MSVIDRAPSPLERRHDDARAAAADGRHDEAAGLLRVLVRDHPGLATLHRNLVRTLVAGGRHWEAVDACRSALIDHPDDRALAELLASAARRTGQHRLVAEAEQRLVDHDPTDVAAHRRLVAALRALGDRDRVAIALRAWSDAAPGDPSARHFRGAYDGCPDPRANDDYVRELFDGYARTFDRHLSSLGYRAPEAIAERIVTTVPFETAVDLGCGTGRLGELVRPSTRRLVGVDLSPGMLAEARERGVFDELVEAELTEFLRDHQGRFDLIVSADTLIYVGDLRPVFAAAGAALRPGGRIAFSVEAATTGSGRTDQAGYVLQDSGRYAHHRRHLVDELRRAGFVDVELADETVRYERGRPVEGVVVTATRPADVS